MKPKSKFFFCFLIAALFSAVVWADEDMQGRVDSSRKVVKQFAAELKGHLKKAVHGGGQAGAIHVCAEIAPEIARKLSEKNDWRVARTSLKYRNSDNAPDSWEEGVLQEFEKRKAAGESLENLEYHEVVEKDGKPVFRFIKAIPTKKTCLICHGESISEDVKQALDRLYPNDKARGFKKNDIRGAFTIEQPIMKAN